MARGERGEDLQPSGVSFPRDTVTEAVWTQFRAFALCWRAGPLEEKLCVEGLQAGGSHTPISSVPRGTCFFNIKMLQIPSHMLV